MPKCRVLERSFINNHLVEPGAVVEYDGPAGSNLEPIEDEKPAKGGTKSAKSAAPSGEGADGLV